MNKIFLFALATLAITPAFALEIQPPVPLTFLAPPLERQAPVSVLAPATNQALSPADAKSLLASTEGPAWRVYAVHAPTCAKGSKPKACKAAQRLCAAAKKFSKKYAIHPTCSALYQQSTVLLTTAAKLPKLAPSEKN